MPGPATAPDRARTTRSLSTSLSKTCCAFIAAPISKLSASARAYAHRLAPLHSFAVEHHRFFQDAEVQELIKERGDIRLTAAPHVAPRRRR